MRNQRRSRLTRTSDKQNKKQALIFVVASIILLFVLIQFGPFLINLFGNAVYTLRGGDEIDQQEVTRELLQPPTLIGIPDATQSARISFNGVAPNKEGVIEIYVNGELEDEVILDENTEFSVKGLPLNKGENIIKARFVSEDISSEYTSDFFITQISEKPKLDIENPIDNATFTRADRSINVRGITDANNSVSVNSFRAIVDSEGNFSYILQLNDGENQISIIVKNPAGVTTQKILKVTFQP